MKVPFGNITHSDDIAEPDSGNLGSVDESLPGAIVENDQEAVHQMMIAAQKEQLAKHETTVAHRRLVLHKILAPSEQAPNWVVDAIDWVAESGRKPVWAELGRLLPVGARAIQDSNHFGAHPKFQEAIDAVQRITSD